MEVFHLRDAHQHKHICKYKTKEGINVCVYIYRGILDKGMYNIQ